MITLKGAFQITEGEENEDNGKTVRLHLERLSGKQCQHLYHSNGTGHLPAGSRTQSLPAPALSVHRAGRDPG